MRRSGSLVAAALSIWACGSPPDASWTFRFEDDATRGLAVVVEARITRGRCEDAEEGEELYREDVPIDSRGPAPPELADGSYAFRGRARNANCEHIARGCENVEVPREASSPVVVRLEVETPPMPACTPEQSCVAGRCAGDDGGAPPVGAVLDVVAGLAHTCALLESGRVACWGSNDYGQLGDGTNERRVAPVAVVGVTDADQITAGHRHTCVRHRSGGASCWGDNDRGQLADETTTDWPMPRRAVLLDGMDIAEIDAGGSHTCARLETGSIVCVGEDRDDQLGDGPDDAPAATLVTVTGITDARAIAMGAAHGCALLASGEVACWGNNDSAQVGSGEVRTSQPTPAVVPGLTGGLDVTAGGNVSCARRERDVVCWGSNGTHAILDDETQTLQDPSPVSGLPVTTRVATSGAHTCGIDAEGTVTCRGANAYGQLGDGTMVRTTAAVRLTGTTATAIATGGSHTCIVDAASRGVRCWGHDAEGQLGRGVEVDSLVPVPVDGIADASAVVAGTEHTCVLAGGAVSCFGAGGQGQLGIGSSPTMGLAPQAILAPAGAAALSTLTDHVCAAIADEATCWGNDGDTQSAPGTSPTDEPTPVPIIPATRVAAGGLHSCALRPSGGVSCWGANGRGQLGEPETERLGVTNVMGVPDAVDVTAGAEHSCALNADRTARCWGGNGAGQLGDGTTMHRHLPADVMMLSDLERLDAGGYFTCALLGDATVHCWGRNVEGQLGRAAGSGSGVPAAVVDVANAVHLSAGDAHACAVLATGTITCWGRNTHGQLGDGRRTASSTAAVTVAEIADAVEVAAGAFHTCALLRDGSVHCWGRNAHGQLGRADVEPYVAAPPASNVALPGP